MKRLIALFLAMLLLSGCGPSASDETTVAATDTQPVTEATQPGCYEPGHTVEQQTDGAVKVFTPEQTDITLISAIGNNLLLLSGTKNVALTLLMGSKLIPYATADTSLNLEDERCSYAALTDGFAYYDPQTNEVVYLNVKLREDSRLPLPEEITGKPFISDSGKVYYAVTDQVREIDPETQIPRMIKKIAGKDLQLTDCVFDGKILSCTYTDEHNIEHSLFLSGETGETVAEDQVLLSLSTWQNAYFATRLDGVVEQQLFGTLDSEAKVFHTPVFAQLLPLNGVLLHSSIEEGEELSFCDLSTGKITSQITLQIGVPTCAFAHKGKIWLLAQNSEESQALYCWDPTKTPAQSETVHTGPLYTTEKPDIAALDACQERVDALNKQYIVRIRIWQEAVKVTGGHELIPEYQPEAIHGILDQLEPVLKQFPEGFLRRAADGYGTDSIRISIVRKIDEGKPAVQFLDEDGDVFLVFAVDTHLETDLPLMLGYPVVSHILGNAVEMDYWTNYNPAGFVYGTQEQNSKYLTGDTRAFADEVSMASVTEDRSRLFAYALMPDRGELFTSTAMQGKLELLCKAIRDAFRLTSYEDVLPWEQYLKISLIPKK